MSLLVDLTCRIQQYLYALCWLLFCWQSILLDHSVNSWLVRAVGPGTAHFNDARCGLKLLRPGLATHAIVCFDNEAFQPAVVKFESGGQPGKTGTNDNNIDRTKIGHFDLSKSLFGGFQ